MEILAEHIPRTITLVIVLQDQDIKMIDRSLVEIFTNNLLVEDNRTEEFIGFLKDIQSQLNEQEEE